MSSTRKDLFAASVLLLGLAQIVLAGLALARVLDPGWTTFGPIGVLAGLGMAAITLVAKHTRFTWPAFIAGLSTAAVWASLLGGTFYTDDLVRVAVVVVSDCLFAVALIVAARRTENPDVVPGLFVVAFVLAVRALVELVLSTLILTRPDPGPGPNLLVLFVAVSVLGGWIVLAVWEIVFGAWLIRSSGSPTAVFAAHDEP